MDSNRNSEPAAYRPEEFAIAHGLSRSALYKLWAEGQGPRRMRIGRSVRISREAAEEWRRRMEEDEAKK